MKKPKNTTTRNNNNHVLDLTAVADPNRTADGRRRWKRGPNKTKTVPTANSNSNAPTMMMYQTNTITIGGYTIEIEGDIKSLKYYQKG